MMLHNWPGDLRGTHTVRGNLCAAAEAIKVS